MGYCRTDVEYRGIRWEDPIVWQDSRPSAWRGTRLTGLARVLLGFTALQVSRASEGEPRESVRFEHDVRPILAANCAGCHGADRPKAGLDLRTVAAMLRGGKSGPALSPSDPDASLLLERIARHEMPPGKARKLSADEVAVVRAWIRAGARADHLPHRVPTTASPVATRIGGSGRSGRCRRPPVPGRRRRPRSHADRSPSCSRGWSRRA